MKGLGFGPYELGIHGGVGPRRVYGRSSPQTFFVTRYRMRERDSKVGSYC